MIEAKILKPLGYTQKEALVLLFNTDSKLDLLDIDEVYYPYSSSAVSGHSGKRSHHEKAEQAV